ncbi:MAG: OmpA family protein [Maritimibacter sp.]|nr:OmpA family protein [Maritimibacter sp.]
MPDVTPQSKLPRSYPLVSSGVLVLAALVSILVAWGALWAVERNSKSAVEHALMIEGLDWARVDTNGLQVFLSGTAPSEPARFGALTAAGHEVDGARVIDLMEVPDPAAIAPPRFSIELLRNQSGISLIGLVPAATDRAALAADMQKIDPIRPVADLLETANYPQPEGWDNAVRFMTYAAGLLPRSKISMDANRVGVEAIANSPEEKADWERKLRGRAPGGLRIALDISAPRPVISPFTLRFISDAAGARFDACTAHTETGRNVILAAGIAAGVKGAVDCPIALGVPSPDWPDAVSRAIRAVREMGGGALTFSDADVSLIAPEGTSQDTYDRVIGELEADLPDVFALHAVLPGPEDSAAEAAGPPEFTATLATGGGVQLRGRVATQQDRTIVVSYARARFGVDKVYAPLTLDEGLPAGWSLRTLAGLEALDLLADGRVVIQPALVTVTGTTGDSGASAEISRILSEKLGEAEDFRVNVRYEEALDPVAAMPTPAECAADINAVLARAKITFAPGSAEIELSSADTVDRIAEIVKTCPDVAMEIAGYTDSQGREEMNQALSQRRAEAVMSALLARRVLTSNLTAFGYGEENPVADNDIEEGREANRRIEFRLVGEAAPRETAEPETGDAPTLRPLARPEDEIGSEDGDAAADDEARAGADEGGAPEDLAQATDPAVGEAAPEDEAGATDAPVADAGDETFDAALDEAVTDAIPEGSGDEIGADPVAEVAPETADDTELAALEEAAEPRGDMPGAEPNMAELPQKTPPVPASEDTAGDAADAEASPAATVDAADSPPDPVPGEAGLPVEAVELQPVDKAAPTTLPAATRDTVEAERSVDVETPEPTADMTPGDDIAAPVAGAGPASPPAPEAEATDPGTEETAGADAGTEDAAPGNEIAGTDPAEATTATDTPAATDEAAGTETPTEGEAATAATTPAIAPGSAPLGTLGLVYGPETTPATRPLRRPPAVVNPDLVTTRPRPRPTTLSATNPDAQSPEAAQ